EEEAKRRLAVADVNSGEDLITTDGAEDDGKVLSTGDRLSWGVTSSLLRLQTSRDAQLSRANPTFRPQLRALPGDIGFQFLSEPAKFPWRLPLQNGGSLQLMSFGGMLLTEVGS